MKKTAWLRQGRIYSSRNSKVDGVDGEGIERLWTAGVWVLLQSMG